MNQTTKLVAVVSQRDVRWQTLSAAGYENGVGFVVMKLGSQSRAKKFSMKELAGMSRTYASLSLLLLLLRRLLLLLLTLLLIILILVLTLILLILLLLLLLILLLLLPL